MPLEYCFRDLEMGRELDNSLLEPGDAVILRVYSQGVKEVLTISCNPEDDGGQVQVFEPVGVLANEFDDIDGEDLPEAIRTAVVKEDKPHLAPAESISGSIGFLIVRHVSSQQITKSMLIPRALIYPDTSHRFNLTA